jgi:hypothetical protein
MHCFGSFFLVSNTWATCHQVQLVWPDVLQQLPVDTHVCSAHCCTKWATPESCTRNVHWLPFVLQDSGSFLSLPGIMCSVLAVSCCRWVLLNVVGGPKLSWAVVRFQLNADVLHAAIFS